MNAKGLAVGMVLGLGLALVSPSCGTTPRARCTKENCKGCCDINGVCLSGRDDSRACGTGAADCKACGFEEMCVNGACSTALTGTCTKTNCSGCCTRDGKCESGREPNNCGTGGNICGQCTFPNVACLPNASKTAYACGACNGCMDSNTSECFTGNDTGHCGIGGNKCQQCGTGSSCFDGGCVAFDAGAPCGAGTCDGCCQALPFGGPDICIAGGDKLACGKGGVQCRQCIIGACLSNGTCG